MGLRSPRCLERPTSTTSWSTLKGTVRGEAGRKEAMTLTPDELKAKLEGAWADVTHGVYFPASNVGIQLSTDRFIEVY
jgi:hypothetical protein